jgi:hypothetical protein
MQKLFNDLGNDENGKPTFKAHLVKDLTEVIIPAVFENIRYVPIPRIEYSDPSFDAVIENLGVNTLKERANQNISDDTKDNARAQRERAKRYLSSKMPEDRRSQTIWRLRKMVTECQGHPDCRLDLFTSYSLRC